MTWMCPGMGIVLDGMDVARDGHCFGWHGCVQGWALFWMAWMWPGMDIVLDGMDVTRDGQYLEYQGFSQRWVMSGIT